jgi:tRNA U34 5-carboxymethylaminomethyl modifying enzyme MnmG/GidA
LHCRVPFRKKDSKTHGLSEFPTPANLCLASRVEGVTPADISILMITLGY